MTITFITGANKGLGRETARRLIEQGHTVIVGARDPELGGAAAADLGARFVPIDVTDDASVAAAAADVEEQSSPWPPRARDTARAASSTATARSRGPDKNDPAM